MRNSKTISEIYKEHKKSFLKHLKSAKSLDEKKIHKLISPVFKNAGKIRTTTHNIKLLRISWAN